MQGQGADAGAGDLGDGEAGGIQQLFPGARRAPGAEQRAPGPGPQGTGPALGLAQMGVQQRGGLADDQQPRAGMAGGDLGQPAPAPVGTDAAPRAVAVVVALHAEAGLAQPLHQLTGEPGHLIASMVHLDQHHQFRHLPALAPCRREQAGIASGADHGPVRIQLPGGQRHRGMQPLQGLAQGGSVEQVVGTGVERDADEGVVVPTRRRSSTVCQLSQPSRSQNSAKKAGRIRQSWPRVKK
jgi:hypothetical protein